MFRKMVGTSLACVLALPLGLIEAQSAHAAILAFPSANGQCNAGDACSWNTDFSSNFGDTPSAISNYAGYGYWGENVTADNRTSMVTSAWFTKSVTFYDGLNIGVLICVPTGVSGNGYFLVGNFNNRVSSHKNANGLATC